MIGNYGVSGFKPYYKWITFNTLQLLLILVYTDYRFKPYYKWITFNTVYLRLGKVLRKKCFKPYYKWITFNTVKENNAAEHVIIYEF